MRETCRICGRELCGNQRRWLFHTAAKLNLQVLLSHVLGKEVCRDGRGEFACSKCAFMLERVYRFDTVMARIEALSLERLHKLLLEKDRLKGCLAGMYKKNNSNGGGGGGGGGGGDAPAEAADSTTSGLLLPEARYSALLQEDFAYSGFECWTASEERFGPGGETHTCCHGGPDVGSGHNRPSRRCRGCSVLRVADADYEAICKIPRKVSRNVSACGASPRCPAASLCNEELPGGEAEAVAAAAEPSGGKAPLEEESMMEEETPGSSSLESLDAAPAPGGAASAASAPQQQKDEEADTEAKRSGKCEWCTGGEHRGPPPPHCVSSLHGNRLDLALNLVKTFGCKPVQSPKGSKLPIPIKSSPLCQDLTDKNMSPSFLKSHSGSTLALPLEMPDLQELWEDLYDDYIPIQVKNLYEDQKQLFQSDLSLDKQTPELNNTELLEKISCLSVTNKQLQDKLNEISFELKSVQHTSWTQDHKIQNLTETLKNKDNESEELNRVIEGQNEMIAKLREMLHKSQLGQLMNSEGASASQQQQIALCNLQNTLFFTQLEAQRLKRIQQQKDHQLAEAKHTTQFLEAFLQEEQHQKEAAWKHNKELCATLQQLETELQNKNCQFCTLEREKMLEIQKQEQKIKHLNQNLTYREQLLQEAKELLQYHQDREKSPTSADKMVQKLHQRIKDRDAALERAVDEKFCMLEEKEQELQQLRLSVKERECDLEGLHQVLSKNKDTIQDLESLLKAKNLEHEHLFTTYKNLQWVKEEMEAKSHKWRAEQEESSQQLQTALYDRNKEVEALLTTLLCNLLPGQRDIVEELYLRLQQKEQIIEGLLSTRSLQAIEQMAVLQELLKTLNTRKQQHHVVRQESSGKTTTAMIPEKRDIGSNTQKAVLETTAGLEKELFNTREDLELLTRKERESKLELSTLQSVVASQEEELQVRASDIESLTRSNQIKEELIKDLQMQLVVPEEMPAIERLTQQVLMLQEKLARAESQGQEASRSRQLQLTLALEGLAAERNQLNETLKAEKQLYSTLVKFHAHSERSGKEELLQAELETVQALRGQLEEALGRSLEHLSRLESLDSFGGGERSV